MTCSDQTLNILAALITKYGFGGEWGHEQESVFKGLFRANMAPVVHLLPDRPKPVYYPVELRNYTPLEQADALVEYLSSSWEHPTWCHSPEKEATEKLKLPILSQLADYIRTLESQPPQPIVSSMAITRSQDRIRGL